MTLRLKKALNEFKPVVTKEDCKIMPCPKFSSINISALNLLSEQAFDLKQYFSNIEKCNYQKKILIKCQM